MRFLSVLRSLPFLPVPYGQAPPQPANLDYRSSPDAAIHAYQLMRRANLTTVTLSNSNASVTTTMTVLTFITPSPSAAPIPITSQSQLITSYIPSFTICPNPLLAPSGVPPLYSNASGSPPLYTNASLSTATLPKRQASGSFPPIYQNTTSAPNATTPACSTIYSPTITPICHTTLTPLGGIPIPILACDQPITFSTDHGYTTTTAIPSIQNQTTYYIAPWASLLNGVPDDVVDALICSLPANGTAEACTTVHQSWSISTKEIPAAEIMTAISSSSLQSPSVTSTTAFPFQIPTNFTLLTIEKMILEEAAEVAEGLWDAAESLENVDGDGIWDGVGIEDGDDEGVGSSEEEATTTIYSTSATTRTIALGGALGTGMGVKRLGRRNIC